MKERLVQLFAERFGSRPEAILDLGADGSTRRYYRMLREGGESVIGAIGPDHEENRAFLSFSLTFRELGLPVPEIYSEDREAGVWLEEDLGDLTLFEALMRQREGSPGGGEAPPSPAERAFPPEVAELYRKVLSWLPRFQVEGHRAVDYRVAYPRQAFDERSIRWDLNYFKYHFLKLAHVDFHEQRLEDDFGRLTELLLHAEADFFLYRDFQSRNIMIREGAPWFIDYQGGRRGALQYDVASLLYDAKADLPDSLREELLGHYLEALRAHASVDEGAFRKLYPAFVLVRLMQALGAYGYRGFFERKRHFLESVPYAARTLAGLLGSGLPAPMPELERVFQRIVDRWVRPAGEDRRPGQLTVLIQSFSFRDGYPPDGEGHGGGFVFDCRSLPNPGRLPEYSELTGRDPEVADFLEREPRVQEFWESVRALVEAHVEDYAARDFESLTISFGCTGGQHRSVFMAEKLAEYLSRRQPPLALRVEHRRL